MKNLYGIPVNKNDTITYHKSFEQMVKESKATEAKYSRIKELQQSIMDIEKIYFKDRSDAQDQYLNELYTQLSAITGVA